MRRVLPKPNRVPIVVGLAAIAVLVIWKTGLLSPGRAGQSDAGAPRDVAAPAVEPNKPANPEANPAAFRGLGDLAFVWQDALYTLSGDTGELRLLTDKGKVAAPAWSADGQWIAFIRRTDQVPAGALWLIRRDGTEEHQVKGPPKSVGPGEFSWSPSASVLAIGGDTGLWIAPVNAKPYQLRAPQGRTWLAWSPDGKALAYSSISGLAETDQQGTPLLTITADKRGPGLRLVALRAGLRVAAWWPDGKGLLYWLDPGSASLEADGMELNSVALDAGNPKPLGTSLGYRDDALWVIGVDDGQVQKVLGSFPGAANPLGFYGFTPYLSDVFSWRRKTHARL
ncbi:MAG: TolB family protein [Bacillota bacterium]